MEIDNDMWILLIFGFCIMPLIIVISVFLLSLSIQHYIPMSAIITMIGIFVWKGILGYSFGPEYEKPWEERKHIFHYIKALKK
ncbi:hypothetical protein KAU40_01550 [Candidatus Parcubacteria bacterium]|nr:hypothetical protein [Candidatus Parcubacteria bacterium]